MSEKLSLPLAVFAIEAMLITILVTLGLMATTLMAISTFALVALYWKERNVLRARS